MKNCIPNCHQIEFTLTEERIARDPELICNDHWALETGNSLENKIAKDIMKKGHYNSMIYKYTKISEWEKLYKARDKNTEFNLTIDKWGALKASTSH